MLLHVHINASCYLDHNILHAISSLSIDKKRDLTFASLIKDRSGHVQTVLWKAI